MNEDKFFMFAMGLSMGSFSEWLSLIWNQKMYIV